MPPPSRRRGWRLPSAGTTRGSRKRTARVGLSSIAATNLRPAAANGPGSWSPTETLVDVGNADAARLNGTEQQRSELALPEPNPPFPRGGAWSLGECSVYRGTPGYWTCNSARHAPNGSWCEGHIAVALTGRSVCRSWRELPRRTRPPAVQANTRALALQGYFEARRVNTADCAGVLVRGRVTRGWSWWASRSSTARLASMSIT
jgi:hypothetical protein